MSDFSLPEGWKVSKLADLAGIYSGGTPDRGNPDFWNGDIPWATPTDITHNGSRTISKTTDKITKKGLGSSSAKLLPPGSVLMTSRATLGESKISTVEICTNQGFKSLVPLKDVDSWFLFYQLQLNKERYAGLGIGSTFLEVNMKDTASFEVPCAPFNEQRKIAKILTTVDNLIEKTEALIAKYEAIKQGMMHDLFTRGVDENGRLRPSYQEAPGLYKETEFGFLPKSWGVFTFDDVTPADAPICYGIVQVGEYDEKGVPVVAIYNLHTDFSTTHKSSVVLESKYIRSRICGDDILLSVKGTIGRVDVVPTWFNGNISRDIARIRTKPNVSSEYLRQFLSSEFFKNHIDNAVVGTTRAELSIGILRKLSLFLPEKNEQDQIAQILRSVDSKLNAEKKYMAKLKNKKTALMQDLLTGKVRVPPDEETKAHV
jgi:type I restriction enzyme, S subunit